MITEVRAALRSLGYTVHNTRQEKIKTKEIVVILDDVDVRIDTSDAYLGYVWILLEWDTTDVDNIPSNIITLITRLENQIVYNSQTPRKATFKFIQSEVNQVGLGEMYRVSIVIEYVEEINLG